MASSTKHVGIYCRISDNDDGNSTGVQRQEANGRELCKLREWSVAKVYVDDGLSAYQYRTVRPSFDDLMSDLESGVIDGFVCQHLDRVTRRLSHFTRVIKVYEQRPELVFASVAGGIDLSSPIMRGLASLLVGMAEEESRAISRRVSDKKRHEALAGRIYSNYPPFYRNPDGSLNPEKTTIILKAVDDVLNFGIRPTSIAQEWRDKGITTARGGRATAETVRRILVSPGMAGFAVYKGQILTGDDGQPIKRLDGGVVDEATWRQLIDKIRVRPSVNERRIKGLLSPILRCGKCGSGMMRRPKGQIFTYICRSKDSGGCASLTISGPKLDAQITEEVLRILNEPYEIEETKPFAAQARLEEVTAKIAELMGQYQEGALSGSLAFPMLNKLEAEQKDLQAQAAKYNKAKRPVIMTAADQWDNLSFAQKQAVLSQLFEAIEIARAKPGYNLYDPTRVQIIRRVLSQQSVKQLYELLKSSFALAA